MKVNGGKTSTSDLIFPFCSQPLVVVSPGLKRHGLVIGDLCKMLKSLL